MTEDTPTFAELGVVEPVVERLAAQGIYKPFAIQGLVMKDALEGRDILGKAKTGSGKTLAFAIPMIQRMEPGRKGTQAVVLVPTRELCAQVAVEVKKLCAENANILAAYGGVGLAQHIKQAPDAHIIVATPGRLIDLIERGKANLSQVHILVIDEADRMADMGFLPQVGKILKHIPNERQTMLFSATLDNAIAGLIAQTKDPVQHSVAEGRPTVESAEHYLFQVHQMDKPAVLASIVQKNEGLTLVFTRTKRMCDRLSEELKDMGLKAMAIHGDLRQGQREDALERFGSGKIDVLVATNVAARGLDIEDVSQVVNYDPPEDFRDYLHRVGRTARAGRSGVGVTLATWEERVEVERMARRLHLDPELIEIFSTDERLSKLGTPEFPGAQHVDVQELAQAVGSDAATKLKGARGGGRRRRRRRF